MLWPADGEPRFCHYRAPGLSPHRTLCTCPSTWTCRLRVAISSLHALPTSAHARCAITHADCELPFRHCTGTGQSAHGTGTSCHAPSAAKPGHSPSVVDLGEAGRRDCWGRFPKRDIALASLTPASLVVRTTGGRFRTGDIPKQLESAHGPVKSHGRFSTGGIP
jgi:hypothetical protein